MREIKFRGKTEQAGRWVYGSLLINWAGTCQIWEKEKDNSLHNYIVTPESVGQFTGLYDKNGREIYEGDIIGRRGFFSRVIEHNGVNMQSYMLNNSSMKWVLTKESFDECDEIIGNIYENPELLEQK